MSNEYQKQTYSHRIMSKSGDPRYNDKNATPHPDLYPYIATEMAAHVWDIQAIADEPLEKMQAKAKDRVWRSKSVCYLVLEENNSVHYSPSFRTGTLTHRPRGGWIMRVSAEDGVDEIRKNEVARLDETKADQLKEREAPCMHLEEPGRGVSIACFCVLVKMDSIFQARDWDWTSFLDFCDKNNHTPFTDGRLVAFSSMSTGDLEKLMEALDEHGMQCQEFPVDYYFIQAGEIGMMYGLGVKPGALQGRQLEHSVISTPHDHEIRLSIRRCGGVWAQLEGVE